MLHNRSEILKTKVHYQQLLANQLVTSLLVLDADFNIVYANPAAVTIIGIPEEKLLSKDFTKLFLKKHHQKIIDLLKIQKETQRMVTHDAPFEMNNNQIMLNIIPIKNACYSPAYNCIEDAFSIVKRKYK